MPQVEVTTSPIADDEAIPETGTVIGGRYVVEALLGMGGMSIVFRARDTRLGHLVALKILQGSRDRRSEHARRFIREAQIIARLRSDHVVSVLDVDAASEPPYLAMELLEGHTVAELLAAHGRFSIDVALRIVAQACRGVADAHALGVMHRDLKPSNLMVARGANGEQRVKVIDFGISKPLVRNPAQSDLTSTGQILGSPRYMSPEQVRAGESIDTRSDIWSLGAILYELIAGVAPFAATTVADTLAQIVRDTPPPLSSYAPAVPRRIASIVALCLSKDPALRPPDVRALLEELEAVISPGTLSVDDIAVEARPKPVGGTTQGTGNRSWSLPRAQKTSRFSRVQIGAALAVVAAIAPWLGRAALRQADAVAPAASHGPSALVAPREPAILPLPPPDILVPSVESAAPAAAPAAGRESVTTSRGPRPRPAHRPDAGMGDEDLELGRRD